MSQNAAREIDYSPKTPSKYWMVPRQSHPKLSSFAATPAPNYNLRQSSPLMPRWTHITEIESLLPVIWRSRVSVGYSLRGQRIDQPRSKTYHIRHTHPVENLRPVISHIMKHSTLPVIEADPKLPLLPGHLASLDFEAWSLGLLHMVRLDPTSHFSITEMRLILATREVVDRPVVQLVLVTQTACWNQPEQRIRTGQLCDCFPFELPPPMLCLALPSRLTFRLAAWQRTGNLTLGRNFPNRLSSLGAP